jgi:hypothetical protein
VFQGKSCELRKFKINQNRWCVGYTWHKSESSEKGASGRAEGRDQSISEA